MGRASREDKGNVGRVYVRESVCVSVWREREREREGEIVY